MTTRLTTDASGHRVGELRYKPYGETRYVWGVTPTDRRFAGQRSEEAALGSLYDYGARRYSPLLARFISADTLVPSPGNPQSLNRYAYTLNNPFKYIDPTGHLTDEQIEKWTGHDVKWWEKKDGSMLDMLRALVLGDAIRIWPGSPDIVAGGEEWYDANEVKDSWATLEEGLDHKPRLVFVNSEGSFTADTLIGTDISRITLFRAGFGKFWDAGKYVNDAARPEHYNETVTGPENRILRVVHASLTGAVAGEVLFPSGGGGPGLLFGIAWDVVTDLLLDDPLGYRVGDVVLSYHYPNGIEQTIVIRDRKIIKNLMVYGD